MSSRGGAAAGSKPQPDRYLAGSTAMLIEPNTTCYGNTRDYCNDSVAGVTSATIDDEQLVRTGGFQVPLI